MALLRRQAVNFEIYDDQSPTLWGSFVGNWSRESVDARFNNGSVTTTTTRGASLSFTFAGSQAWLYGALLNVTSANGEILSYPTANYLIDDFPVSSQKPWIDHTGAVVYFETQKLADGTHEIDITVTGANSTNPYILDYFLVTPNAGSVGSGVGTSRGAPSPTSTPSTLPITTASSTPVGPIVGGVVGGIAGIALLAIALWYFLRKRTRGGQAFYFEKPSPTDMLAGEDQHVEPFNATTANTTPAPSSAGFGGAGPRSAFSDGSSQQPLHPPSDITGLTHVTGISAQPRTGKAALMAQQYQSVQQPVQLEDSGIRFGENGEQGAGPSQLPNEVPPSYTPA